MAVQALARRPRTAHEVDLLLRRRGIGAAAAARALATLKELGYVDDLRYAASFVANVAVSRAWGPARVRQELAKRGVEREVIDAALREAAEDGVLPSANLDRAIARWLRARGMPVDRKGRDRLRAALLRQGFDAREIALALAALGGGDDEPVEAEFDREGDEA